MSELPLFPLHTVLFPGGALPLRIFEPRYLDMVSRCLKTQTGFGVCLIEEGGETGHAKMHRVGTLAEIGDWSRGEDGLLHILGRGTRRFRTVNLRVQADGLNLAEVEWLPEDPPAAVPEARRDLVQLLQQVMQQLEAEESQLDYTDAAWVTNRLTEVLPINLAQRQYLLETGDPLKRLDILATLVQSLTVN